MKTAEFYEKRTDNYVQCTLCPHNCLIAPGNTGKCRSRQNEDGILYTLNYGKTVTISLSDPVEKKPLFHFLPGSHVLSIGSNLCNMTCNYCQNYQISQEKAYTENISNEQLEKLLKRKKLPAIAYTYTEPVIWYEFVKDSAKYLQYKGIKTIMVSNGFINPEPLEKLIPYISAFNIDLKSIKDDFYRRNCGAWVEPVKDTIKMIFGKSHLEITNLIITDENDTEEEIIELIDFIASVDKRIPLHFSRYYPVYKLNNPPTSLQKMKFAYEKAKQKLYHVYLGNVHFHNHLICENCKNDIAMRAYGHSVDLQEGKCPHCGHINYGVW